ncbi:hypothetical protein [Burkholderia multivorans]|jgi:hypothetical protein|uniref:hypothetical protein n=1 Tax=Burkholderia multivorans TaxID=87883 RepID=UPI0015E3384C|nr:hypothetical protein [Burkholderia multivorans]MBU9567431.1 hypothetical protein [Burkholderia multivorans]MBU9589398.1 hypothetical protein [Burkholderia multivorans]MCO8450899.1 hypothetical protein [Burkholderia multivorans]MCO8462674.1 hypothetical protein [Burkholderia multivorans]MDN8027648.1 hypothetical protein [Burkholderia multivorans]
MTSTRKTLMIAGGLLVAAAATGYVMLLRADHRAIAEAGLADSSAPGAAPAPAVATPPADDGHTAQGAIAPPVAKAASAAHPTLSASSTPAALAPAPAVAAAPPAPAPPAPAPARPAATPSVKVVTVDAQDAPAPAPAHAAPPQQHARRQRDGIERHAAVKPATTKAEMKAETPETAALVRESAKLDPSLPPPTMPVVATTGTAHTSTTRHGASSGANPVAAAMTEQLVRESTNLSAPPPRDNAPAK